ncbi:hypothetical protein PN498_09895 [Oscillatoria sp. CS-180]|uniref:hypothetical protein n=1 Tax=Oscillatoria sp. CS-180 TaxID=3021720 RepID=UPI0023304EA7|nr:hypothetical protein [Oscillatoria sp. CS-180]MDB9526297.1 hypothetical protein [Oscillatoria sp. CS-180]
MDKKRDRGVALFLSVLLHSLLALFPWQEKPRPLMVSSIPASPISPARPVSVVDASQLPTLPAPKSQPLPAVPSRPPASDPPPETNDTPTSEPASKAAPRANLPSDAPIPETSNSPVDKPVSEITPDSDTVPAATPSPVPSTPTSVMPGDEAQTVADWENLVGYFKDQDEGFEDTPLLDIFTLFGESGQVNQFFDENNQPKLVVSSYYLFPTQTPEQVLQTVVIPEITNNTGFDLQPQENFSAGRAYQLLQGEMLRYLIIVRLNEGSGSILMLSESLSGLES